MSDPKQPALLCSDPPTMPGIPRAHSIPVRPAASAAWATLTMRAPAPARTNPCSTVMALSAARTTRPSMPSSEISRLLPLPSMVSGNPAARHRATISPMPAAASRYQSAGPPIR